MANFFKEYRAGIKSKREQQQQNSQGNINDIKKGITQFDVETAIIKFLEDQPETEYGEVPFPEVDNVRPFEDYLLSNNNGVVIGLKDGTQICLTIRLR